MRPGRRTTRPTSLAPAATPRAGAVDHRSPDSGQRSPQEEQRGPGRRTSRRGVRRHRSAPAVPAPASRCPPLRPPDDPDRSPRAWHPAPQTVGPSPGRWRDQDHPRRAGRARGPIRGLAPQPPSTTQHLLHRLEDRPRLALQHGGVDGVLEVQDDGIAIDVADRRLASDRCGTLATPTGHLHDLVPPTPDRTGVQRTGGRGRSSRRRRRHLLRRLRRRPRRRWRGRGAPGRLAGAGRRGHRGRGWGCRRRIASPATRRRRGVVRDGWRHGGRAEALFHPLQTLQQCTRRIVGRGQQHAGADQLQQQSRRGSTAHLHQSVVDDIGAPGKGGHAQSRRLR